MKHFYTAIFFALCTCALSAQNFQLFNSDSKKVFTTSPVAGKTYNMAFEDVQVNGGITTYIPYKGLEDYETEMGESCMTPSSSGFCFPESRAGWLGNSVTANNSTNYTFHTVLGSDISLNTNQPMGDGVIFYQDSIQKFYFNRLYNSFENICGVMDSVKNIEIIHTDLSGNIINSPLNSFIIKTGKALGLVNFFVIDSFPQVMKPLTLIGNVSPVAGLTQITNEDLYALQPGDELQFNEKSIKFTCHAEVLYDRFVKLNYLERTDTPDSIIFVCRREMFQRDSLKLEVDTVRMAYNRHIIVATIPFDYSSHDQALYRKTLVMNDFCGEPLWSFNKTYLHMWYCEETDCWSWQDLPYLPMEESETVVWGVGRYFYHFAEVIDLETHVYDYQVNYFKKGQLVCGDQMIVSTKNLTLPGTMLTISPNPAKESITITGFETGKISIITLEGRVVKQVDNYVSGQKLMVNDLHQGIYLVRIDTDKGITTGKLLLQ